MMFRGLNRIVRPFSKILDHYQVLNLPKKGLTIEMLNTRFVELSKTYHPDISPESGDKFMEIRTSYEALKEELKAKGPTTGAGATGKPKSYYQQHKPAEDNFQKDKKIFDFKTEEEYIYYTIFGSSYEEDPLRFFLKENAAKRDAFREKVSKLRREDIRKELSDEEFIRDAFKTEFVNPGNREEHHHNDEASKQKKIIVGGLFALAAFGSVYVSMNQQTETKKVLLLLIYSGFKGKRSLSRSN